jgi:hypothetical protein
MKFRRRALLIAWVLATTSHAGDFVVVANSDSGPGSLRQAILDANATGGGQITFSNPGPLIILSNQLPVLTNEIQILGPGPDQLSIQGPRVFTNAPDNLAVISGLQITNSPNAIANLGTLIVSNCTIVNGSSGSPSVPPYLAPGIYNSGTLIATYCSLSGNYTFVDKEGTAIHNAGTMNLAFCTITNNGISFGTGCGVFNRGNLTADYCVISQNGGHDCDGSGLSNDAGSVILRNCSVNGNAAFGAGGILNHASLAMTNCTLDGNSAYYSDGAQTGGGMVNYGYAALQNTTVSGNSARPAGVGAGIWNDGTLELLNATVASNHVDGSDCYDPSSGAGIYNSGVVRSRNSIIAANYTTLPCSIQGVDFSGNLESLGHNLIQNAGGWTNTGAGTGDIVGLDPKLGPLQDNGGPTWTHALLAGSPAIDAGESTSGYVPTEDQRGVPRPQGVAVDIGAFEYQFTDAVFMRFSRTNSQLHFEASAPPLKTHIVQSSTNLVIWQDNFVSPVTATSNGVVDFYVNEYTLADNPKLFFRLKSQ